jgi:lysophospholipase L1-like esterase
MDDPLGAVNYGGDYSCNGRQDLPMILHSCKPLNVILLALGCNDCKSHLNLSPEEITSGAKILIHDVRRSYQCGPPYSNQPPAIVLITPGVIQITPQSLAWGFQGAAEKSRLLPSLYRNLAEQESVFFFDTQAVAETSPLDGVHFDTDQQESIAAGLAELIAAIPS